MEGSRPRVSIVIPNRNGVKAPSGLRYLDMVMTTLREQSFQDFDVTIVDNGSTDGSVEYLDQHWPHVRTIALPGNLGFPTAVNRGIEATRGEYFALLNNDLELSPDWLERLVRQLDCRPGAGFATGKIMRYDQRGVLEQAGQDLYTCGRFAPRGLDQPDRGQYDDPREITIASAAAAIYRRDAFATAGEFDEDYFLYCEDADLCLRMLLSGYRGIYVPEAAAFHVRGGTADQESELTKFYVQRNTLVTLFKDLPASTLWKSLPKIVLYQLHQLRVARQLGSVRTLLRSYASFLRTLPRTLSKRRQIVRQRRLPTAEFESFLLRDYPLPTPLDRLRRRHAEPLT